MSQFQIALIVAGVVFVGFVWVVNIVQERRFMRHAERLLSGERADVLAANMQRRQRIEPEIDEVADDDAPRAWESVASQSSTEQADLTEDAPFADAPAFLFQSAEHDNDVSPLPEEIADERIDCVVHFELTVPAALPWEILSASAAWEAGAARWLGLLDESVWQPITANDELISAQYVAALQLVSRQGVVAEYLLDDFLTTALRLTHLWHLPAPPAREQVLQRARQLDQFCTQVDVQLGIHLLPLSGSLINGAKLLALANQAGLSLGLDGRFHVYGGGEAGGAELFSIANFDGRPIQADTLARFEPAGLSFLLDVPRVAQGGAVFDRLQNLAREMSRILGARLYDQTRKPLDEVMLVAIRNHVIDLQRLMENAQIPPGGALALRLFA